MSHRRPLKKRPPGPEPLDRLSAVHWTTVLDVVDGWRADRLEWGEIEGKLRGMGIHAEDLAEVESRHRKMIRERIRAERDRAETPLGAAETGALRTEEGVEADGAPVNSGPLAELCEVLEFICGEPIAKARVRWRTAGTAVLRPGDSWRSIKGPGRDWQHEAVEITRADGTVEVFPEHRVKCAESSAAGKYRNPRLHLKVLSFEGECLNSEAVMRRLAAVRQAFFPARSHGVKSGAGLARLQGVSRQAINGQMDRLRKQYESRTGDSGESLNGCVPSRGRRRNTERSQSPAAGPQDHE